MYAASSGPDDTRPEENGEIPTGRSFGPRHALAGLQAGVLGALVIFACLMIGSLWDGRSIWAVPNLFATTFFGSGVYRNQLLRSSWTGIALIVAVYGVLGTVWGCIWRDRRKPWLRLYGAIAGLSVYFVFYGFLWRHVNPLVTLYAPNRQLLVGHVLWGIVLARSPLYARRIAASTIPGAVHDAAAEEFPRSGEVIR
jgi:hypothetical protein